MKNQNLKTLSIFLLVFICLMGFTRADEPKPKTKALSKEEVEKTVKIGREVYEANNAFQQAVSDSLGIALDDCPKVTAALATIRIRSERLNGIVVRQNDLREVLREAHDCKGCDWAPDGKSLVQSPPAPGN
jgi:hypothetical protein